MEKGKIKVIPGIDTIVEAAFFIEKALVKADVSRRDILEVGVIVDEIFSNIVRYSGASEAIISYAIDGGLLTLEFKDNGMPYDPMQKEDPDITLPAQKRQTGGLGIFMVRHMVRHMGYDYRNGYNTVTVLRELLH